MNLFGRSEAYESPSSSTHPSISQRNNHPMMTILTILAQSEDGAAAGGAGGSIVGLIVGILVIAGMWKVFTKAGKPGWAAIIPIYNAVVLLQIAGKPLWWLLLFFIPIVNIVVAAMVMIGVAK